MEEIDIVSGAPAIAKALGLSERQVRLHHEKRRIPTFKIGKTVCARRSTLNAWLASLEAAATSDRKAQSNG